MEQWNAMSMKKERRGKRAELPEEVAKKLKSCSVLGCEEWRDLSSHTTYHCFPTGDKNHQRWEIWTSLLQKARDDEKWIPFRGSLVCSHHFRPIDFVQDPHQKRTKLVKNAIPSIFPTFTVDLEDPNYILEDSNDEQLLPAVGGMDGWVNGDIYYEDNVEDGYEYDQGDDGEDAEQMIMEPEVQVEYEEYEDEEYQYDQQYIPQQQLPRSKSLELQKSRPLPTLTPAANFRKPPSEYEPPAKKSMVVVEGLKKPPLTFKGTISDMKPFLNNSRAMNNNNSNTQNNTSGSSKLYEQLSKSLSNGKLPLSWNSDLEIEVVETNSDDSVTSLKQRIEELESENETLKQKFGAQIRALQRKIKEQEKIIESVENADIKTT